MMNCNDITAKKEVTCTENMLEGEKAPYSPSATTASALDEKTNDVPAVDTTSNNSTSTTLMKKAVVPSGILSSSPTAAVEMTSLKIFKANQSQKNELELDADNTSAIETNDTTTETNKSTEKPDILNHDSTTRTCTALTSDASTGSHNNPTSSTTGTTTDRGSTNESIVEPNELRYCNPNCNQQEQRLIQTLQNEKQHLQNQCSIYESNHTHISIENIQLKKAMHDYQHTIQMLQERNGKLSNDLNHAVNKLNYVMWNWNGNLEKRVKEFEFHYRVLLEEYNSLKAYYENRANKKPEDENNMVVATQQSQVSKQSANHDKAANDTGNNPSVNSQSQIPRPFLQPRAAVHVPAATIDNIDPIQKTEAQIDSIGSKKNDDDKVSTSMLSTTVPCTQEVPQSSSKPTNTIHFGDEASTPKVRHTHQINNMTNNVTHPLPTFPETTTASAANFDNMVNSHVTPSPPMRVQPNHPMMRNGNYPTFSMASPQNHIQNSLTIQNINRNHYCDNHCQQHMIMSPYSAAYQLHHQHYSGHHSFHQQVMPVPHHSMVHSSAYPRMNNDVQEFHHVLSSPSHQVVMQQIDKKLPTTSPITGIGTDTSRNRTTKKEKEGGSKGKGPKKRKVVTTKAKRGGSNGVAKQGKQKKVALNV